MHDLSNVKPLTEAEAAYIAGFLDADGCITLQCKKRNKKDRGRYPIHFHPIVSFANNRINVLYWIKRRLGEYGNLTDKGKSQDRSYVLYFSSSVIRWLLPQIEPYLILKRDQAKLLIEYCSITMRVRGGKIKTEQWEQNFKRYFQIYLNIRCLNNDISYGMIFKKSGELLENPKSHYLDNVVGNDERDRIKRVVNWIISSQAYRNCMEVVGGKVQRLLDEDAKPISPLTVPEPKGKI